MLHSIFMEEKKAVRAQMRRLLSEISEKEHDYCSHKASVVLMKSDLFISAQVVLSYMAMPSELDPFRLTAAALHAYKVLAVPRCVPHTNRLDFFCLKACDGREQFDSQFTTGAFGVREPKPLAAALLKGDSLKQKKICVVVPGLAFTERGSRLGHGKGYYDGYLAWMKEQAFEHDAELSLVGFCFDFQILDALPVESHDIRMDYLCCPSGIIRCPHC